MASMALRAPIYLDVETLLSQVEYFDVQVPQQAEIVEKTVRKRSGGGKAGLAGVGLDALLVCLTDEASGREWSGPC